MLCSQCGKNEAAVLFKQLVNNQVSQALLCKDCAGSLPDLNPESALLNLLSAIGAGSRPGRPASCASCGLKLSQFSETGRLGCARCYDSFYQPLGDLLRRMHGSSRHTGKKPRSLAAPPQSRAEELRRLRAELRAAVDREQFETAAQLRDRIQKMEHQQ